MLKDSLSVFIALLDDSYAVSTLFFESERDVLSRFNIYIVLSLY